MTPKQMYQMMRLHRIGVWFWKETEMWYAGKVSRIIGDDAEFVVDALNPAIVARAAHCGDTPEIAVEDYCNARNLEWDV